MKTYDQAFANLIMRSPEIENGWRNVSKTLSAFVEQKAKQTPELFETRTVDSQMQIRFSDTGSVATAWKGV